MAVGPALMTPSVPVDQDVLDAVVERIGSVDRARGLAALARAIDRRGADRPSSPLALQGLEALTPVGATRERDPALDEALDAVLDRTDGHRSDGSRGDGPMLLGAVHEALLERGQRRRRGAFYTPADVARHIAADVVGRLEAAAVVVGSGAPSTAGPPAICDPALGGGVFLLAVADELVALGHHPLAVVEQGLWGSDVDPLAAAVAEAALVLWARAHGHDVARVNVVCADPLHGGAGVWPDAPEAGFAAVVGNPPFLNQLGARTSRRADEASAMRARWGEGVYRYTDTAAVFLLAATQLTAVGGVVAMIVPVPVLVASDTDRLRRALLERAVPEHLWIARDDVFGLGVSVCAPVLRVLGDGRTAVTTGDPTPASPQHRAHGRVSVTRTQGRGFDPIAPRAVDLHALGEAGTWGPLVADTYGVPPAGGAASRGRLGDFCTATAGFRDQYYGLAPFVVDAGDRSSCATTGDDGWAALITSGLIDPVHLGWGTRPCRFAGRAWHGPLVDLARLEAEDRSLAAWTRSVLVPKVVVATQTRVLEAVVDVDGSWFPSVPTIALVPEPDRLWAAAAVVLAPSTSAWAMNRHVGAALSADALRISAKQLLDAPLPADGGAWRDGAEHLQLAAAATDADGWHRSLATFGATMARAYAAPDDVLAWWVDRLPRWR